MARKEFTKKVKLAAFQRADGRCEKCFARLLSGGVEYDHDLPDALGGEPTLANCKVLCAKCHREKTSNTDVPTIARSNRRRNSHAGIKKVRRGPAMAGGKDSGWKKTFNRGWVRR